MQIPPNTSNASNTVIPETHAKKQNLNFRQKKLCRNILQTDQYRDVILTKKNIHPLKVKTSKPIDNIMGQVL